MKKGTKNNEERRDLFMKLSKTNYEGVITTITQSVERWLEFATSYTKPYEKWLANEEKANKLLKKGEMYFSGHVGLSVKDYLYYKKWYDMIPVAEAVLNNLDKIHINVIQVFIDCDIDTEYYPAQTMDWLYKFQYFCFNDDGEIISLNEQNLRLSNYVHFDAGLKVPKTMSAYAIA